MRSLLAGSILLLLLAPSVPSSAAPERHDWLLAEVKVPVSATGYDIRLTTFFESDVPELVYGLGYDLGWHKSISANVIRASGGATVVTVGPIRHEFEVTPGEHEGFGLGGALSVGGPVSAGQTLRFLVMLPGASISGGIAGVEIGDDYYPATIQTGPGSRIVRATDPGVGLVVQHGGAVSGRTVLLHEVEDPIAAAPLFGGCITECVLEWTAPDGTTGSWTQYPTHGGGDARISEAPGLWRFMWRGASEYDSLFVYAPVGNVW